MSVNAQGSRARGNPRPTQPFSNTNPYVAAYGRGHYAPYPVKDSTAAERAFLAGRVYWTAVDEAVQRALTPPRPAGGPPDGSVLFRPELAERLGRWSLRWQEAEDNAAKSLAGRYRALSDHLNRMTSLADGRPVREAVGRTRLLAGRSDELVPPPLFVGIARFFRPVDEWGMDQVVPELVEVERPLNPRGMAVTPGERVEISGRAYRTILDDAVARVLAARRSGAARRDEGAIFDAALAERLGSWSDLWSQAEDAAVTDRSWRAAVARDHSARPAWAGVRLAGPDPRPATIRSHIGRMSALEDGRFWDEALRRAGRPDEGRIDMTQFREFADVARFFRIEAESRLPGASRPDGADAAAAGQVAGRIYRAIWDEAVRRYLEAPRAGEAPAEARPVFDTRLAERLGSWSIRWGRAQAGAGSDRVSRFAAVRAHVERMASLEDGRALHDALAQAGRGDGVAAVPALPRKFTELARFFRLEATWELERIKSR